MQRIAILLASLLALLAATGDLAKAAGPSDKLESVLLMRVNSSITLDADGKLVDFVIKTPLIPSIKDSLERSIRHWQFKPVVIAGTPRPISSDMRVVLSARKAGGDYQIAIDNVLFLKTESAQADTRPLAPPPLGPRALPPPAYPQNNWPATGRVLLAICVAPDGHAERVEAVQSMLSNIKGDNSVLLKVIKAFEKTAIDGSKGWTFYISPERARMSAYDRTGILTVNFYGDEQPNFDKIGVWNTVVRGPLRRISWAPESKSHERGWGVADLAKGEMLQLDSPIEWAISGADQILQ